MHILFPYFFKRKHLTYKGFQNHTKNVLKWTERVRPQGHKADKQGGDIRQHEELFNNFRPPL